MSNVLPELLFTWLQQLVSIDTTSRNSNLSLINTVEEWLKQQGIDSWLVYNADRTKANLFATIADRQGRTQGGTVLSGHTDVVPVDRQNWHYTPFTLTEHDNRLYGRGSADMKGFLAAVLSLVPEWIQHRPTHPLHLAFSYDEEVGCLGAPSLLDTLKTRHIEPEGCIIGEPTGMQVVVAHKGINLYRCCIHGKAAHSSLTPKGSNAIEYAARLICHIRDMAETSKAQGPYDECYDVPFTTLTTNQIQGGTATNIIPEFCEFFYEFRNLPGIHPDSIQQRIENYVRTELLPKMQREYTDARIVVENLARSPALEADEQAALTKLARSLTGDTQKRKVAFATEGGYFSSYGIPTVVCGPGHIDQAHQPDEYIEINQLKTCVAFLRKLAKAG